jgi:hypothetical protein
MRRLLFVSLAVSALLAPLSGAEAQNRRKNPKIDHALLEALQSGARTQEVLVTL